MTIENLENELKNGSLSNLYLLYGEEKFLVESCLKKIKKNFGEIALGINYIQIDESNINTLLPELETPAFGYPMKLIIVKNANLLKKETKRKVDNEEIKQKLINFLNENNNQNLLVIIEDVAEKNAIFEAIQKNGVVCNFEFQKPMQIVKRLKAICNAYKVNVDNNTLNHLIDISGVNMQNLINELRKLIEFAGSNGTIKEQDVDAMSIRTIDSNIFDLTDNLGKKNIASAMNILDDLLYNKEPIQKILVTLYNHLKKLYIVKKAEEENRNINIELKLKPNQAFLANKYKMQSRFFTEEELKTVLQKLIDLDYNYKIGNIDINIGLESILCGYCS